MKKCLAIGLAGVAAMTFAGTAQAQSQAPDRGGAHPYAGVQAGYHDLNVDQNAFPPLTLDDSAIIYGAYAGVDVDLSRRLLIGVEGNFNLGSSAIDSEYGGAVRLGYRTNGGTILYGRIGYQWIDIDVANFTGVPNPPAGIEDTDDDMLFGLGTDIAVGRNAHLRLGVDTIAFDSLRGTTGIGIRF